MQNLNRAMQNRQTKSVGIMLDVKGHEMRTGNLKDGKPV